MWSAKRVDTGSPCHEGTLGTCEEDNLANLMAGLPGLASVHADEGGGRHQNVALAAPALTEATK